MTEVLDLSNAARQYRPNVGGYPQELFPQAIATWKARMVNEYASSQVFRELSSQLAQAGFGDDKARCCLEFADEEQRHGVFCGAVVEALGGRAQFRLPVFQKFPLHEDAPPRAAALRNVIHVCCMSETVAVALIGAERLQMPKETELFVLLTQIYADEVGHARFGWRLLEEVGDSLTGEEKQAIERYLAVALTHLIDHELAHLPNRRAPPDGACLGLCSGIDARELLDETVHEVIVPGLRRWFRW